MAICDGNAPATSCSFLWESLLWTSSVELTVEAYDCGRRLLTGMGGHYGRVAGWSRNISCDVFVLDSCRGSMEHLKCDKSLDLHECCYYLGVSRQ